MVLPAPLGPSKPDDLAALQRQADAAHHGALLKLLPMRVTTRPLPPSTTRGRWRARTSVVADLAVFRWCHGQELCLFVFNEM